ncbi:MAG: amidohydrolase family protein [Bacteroidales bacterium]|nr:amidohydrolase family protein [Bacteroidales bacterium]
MRIDAHQHFWSYNKEEYGWIGDHMDLLKHDFLPPDLLPELVNAGFDGSVAVQARQTAEETKWLLKLSEQFDFIKGVVGWADLRSEDNLRRQLDEFCKSEKFVGVRHVVHDEPEDNFMLRDEFLKGISILKDYNLTYDLLLFPKHLPVAQVVVEMFPDQKFVIDHISKPLIRSHILDPWQEDIKAIAEFRNVYCKLSGMVTEADWQKWNQEDFRPYLDVVSNAFGTDRIMAGSDWPVCLLGGSYHDVTGIVKDYIRKFPEEIHEEILGLNCADFYGLSLT